MRIAETMYNVTHKIVAPKSATTSLPVVKFCFDRTWRTGVRPCGVRSFGGHSRESRLQVLASGSRAHPDTQYGLRECAGAAALSILNVPRDVACSSMERQSNSCR